MMQRMLRRTEFAEKITTRGVYQIWHCNVASRVTKSLEAPKKGIDLIHKLGRQARVPHCICTYVIFWTNKDDDDYNLVCYLPARSNLVRTYTSSDSPFNVHLLAALGLAPIKSILDFIGAKNGCGGDNWSNKTCIAPIKMSSCNKPTPSFYRPVALPVAPPTVSEHTVGWATGRATGL